MDRRERTGGTRDARAISSTGFGQGGPIHRTRCPERRHPDLSGLRGPHVRRAPERPALPAGIRPARLSMVPGGRVAHTRPGRRPAALSHRIWLDGNLRGQLQPATEAGMNPGTRPDSPNQETPQGAKPADPPGIETRLRADHRAPGCRNHEEPRKRTNTQPKPEQKREVTRC